MIPTFSSDKLKQVIHHINSTARDLADNFGTKAGLRDCIDAKDAFGAFSPDVISGLAFGLKINSQNDPNIPFIKNVKALLTVKFESKVMAMLAGLFRAITLPILRIFDLGFFDSKMCEYFKQYIETLLLQRQSQPLSKKSMDFLQFLLDAEAVEGWGFQDRKLSMKEIAGQFILFIIAGYETTSSALQFITYELGKNKLIQDKVRKEIRECVCNTQDPTYEQIHNLKFISAVISEALRMYPSLHFLTRRSSKACTVNGVEFPAPAF